MRALIFILLAVGIGCYLGYRKAKKEKSGE